MNPSTERILSALRSVTGEPRYGNGQFLARCPAHEDRTPSLAVRPIEGSTLLYCHGGCHVDDVLAALNMTRVDLFDEKRGATYRYDSGRIVHRTPDKKFRQSGDLSTVELYHLSRLREATDGAVFLVEGEKDVLAIEALNGIATTAPMGAKNFAKVDVSPLKGRYVTAVVDRDEPGATWAGVVAGKLAGVVAGLRFVQAKTGKDAADHIAAGHGLEEFVPVDQPDEPQADPRAGIVELDQLLAEPETPYDWLIPGLIERGDRIIVTGQEGHGKSTLLRQLALQLSCGIHPFGDADFPPLRVGYFDFENGRRHTKRELRSLRLAAADRYKPEPGMHVVCRPQGIDLLDPDDGNWLLAAVSALGLDVLILGPLYKLASGDPIEERTARTVALWLDRIRRDANCALILEAHTPYASNGRHRPERPYGASLWKRWPEFGMYLSPEGHLRHWRGQRDEREWPAALKRGGEWPWTPVDRERDQLWAKIAGHCSQRGEQVSLRALAVLCGTSLASVQRAIHEHRSEWDSFASAQVNGGDTP